MTAIFSRQMLPPRRAPPPASLLIHLSLATRTPSEESSNHVPPTASRVLSPRLGPFPPPAHRQLLASPI